jgi:hypothetical protein
MITFLKCGRFRRENVPLKAIEVVFSDCKGGYAPLRVKKGKLSSRISLTRKFFDLELIVSAMASSDRNCSQTRPAYVAVSQDQEID